jgi:hypothetical protein
MGIQPNVEIVRRVASSSPHLQAVTGNIVHAVKRGKCITDEILRFTRRSEPDIQRIEVTTFMERWQEDVRHVLGASIDLVMNLPSAATYVRRPAADRSGAHRSRGECPRRHATRRTADGLSRAGDQLLTLRFRCGDVSRPVSSLRGH